MADEEAAFRAVQAAVDAFGRLDVVVNNAGFGDIAPFEQLSSARFKAVIDTNFYGGVNVTRAALPIMRKQKSGSASDRLPAHLLLGSDAVQFAGQAEATRAADAELWREISVSTDVNEPGLLPAFQF